MQILIVGSGGREHALAWQAAQHADKIYVAPGNAGTALEAKVENIPIAADNIAELCAFAKTQKIDLTIVGPEAPLTAGIQDAFAAQGLHCYGPCQAAARLEGSKSFAKDFMQAHGIPTAAYATFNELEPAMTYIREQGTPIVIKADGLAAGKGVIIAEDLNQAEQTLRGMFSGDAFADAGKQVVIEEFLTGEEASFMAVCDGKTILPLATSQDHKARDDGDLGPNTGGMGAYSPAPVVSAALSQQIMQKVMQPVLDGMAAQGTPYTGFLYAGLMIKPDGDFKVLEFNCRLGDPETQVIMLRLQSDLVELCLAACQQRLAEVQLQWDARPALGVVLAAKGYPNQYAKGDVINGATAHYTDGKVFHAGTKQQGQAIVSNGGRVLCAAAFGDDFKHAQQQAYRIVDCIDWNNKFYRHDIGHRVCAK